MSMEGFIYLFTLKRLYFNLDVLFICLFSFVRFIFFLKIFCLLIFSSSFDFFQQDFSSSPILLHGIAFSPVFIFNIISIFLSFLFVFFFCFDFILEYCTVRETEFSGKLCKVGFRGLAFKSSKNE